MTHLRIGQKVIYVDDAPRPGAGIVHETAPKVGHIYTIREIVPAEELYGLDENGLLLVEVVNRMRKYVCKFGPVVCEMCFRESRFRPVQTTNIDMFLRMAGPQARRRAPVPRRGPSPRARDTQSAHRTR
jgi:hypothetical protein